MKRERVLVIILIVTAVLTLLFTSLATADTVAEDAGLSPTPQKEEAPNAVLGGGGGIIFTKTVGIDSSSCADTKTFIISPGTEVTYCYTVANTGGITLTVHDLEDSELGVILDGLPFTFIPNSTIWLTQSAVITTPTVNTATWTAYNPGPTNTTTYANAATAIANDFNTCTFPNLSIPDHDMTGITATVNAATAGKIVDLDVYVEADHAWVGDLKFTLEHVNSGITTTLIDRLGEHIDPTFGCQSNDIRAIIDDEAVVAAETSCGPSNLALAGHFVGGDPVSNTLLTAFDGQELMGAWNLYVTDNSSGDTGTLNGWCLLPTLAEPDISLNPTAMVAMQPPNVQTTQILNLQNSGDGPLDWIIHKSLEEVTAVNHSTAPFISPQTTVENLHSKSDANASDDNVLGDMTKQTAVYGPIAAPPISVLYDNGPLINMPGAGAGGADASVVQDNSQGMSSFGFAHQAAFGNTVADDFTVSDPNGWYIDEITFFAYQTDSPLVSTITAVNYRIWDGRPNDPASTIVFGHTLPNRLADTTWSGIYRVRETSLSAVNRPIMQNTASGGLVLNPGTYWLEWQAEGSLPSGPWAPPITISGVVTSGNAMQYFNSTWSPMADTDTGAQQGLPFIISGYALENISLASADSISGTLPAGTAEVMITFDSTGLALGVYTGTLLVTSNDPDTPLIPVPLTLTVEMAHLYLPYIAKP